ncbi:MAG TPA: hypothetical protein VH724_04655 [Candidatus Angelobacter sp.]|nr:hypothetical protein [Candidatus Angelobacter sp.]
MARKKPAPKKRTAGKKKPIQKKKPAARKKSAAKKKPAAKRIIAKKKPAAKPAQKKKSARAKSSVRRREITNPIAVSGRRGLGPESGGQSGDTQGLSRRENANSESVEELLEEGQYLEADAVSGVENAKDPDEDEVTTSEVLEDDVPEEYTDRD